MAVSTRNSIVTNGLVLYLDAANSKSYVSGSTTWSDMSGNGNSGSLINGPTFNSGNGGSIVFDGVNDYVVTTSINNFTSIGGWFYIGSGGTPWKYIIDARAGLANSYFTQFQSGGGIGPAWTSMYVNGVNLAISYANIPINTWFYLYLTTATSNTAAITFMSRYVGNGENSQGNISTIHAYNRNLTQAEVLQNYNATKTRFNLT